MVILVSGCLTVDFRPRPEPEIPVLTKIEPPDEAPVQRPPDYEGLLEAEKTAVRVYHELNRAVVNITSISIAYSWFFQPFPQEGSGSGAIIDEAGLVLTNLHVVRDAKQLAVTLYDGSRYLAEIVGRDPENDLALLSFDPEGRELMTIPFGTSKNLQVGQMVLALGNPFGLERTLTTGIISGLNRPLQTEDGFLVPDLIQTDASINPGNSGGPLLDSRGRMIGVNTMIISPSRGSVGIGFAVPVDTARRVIPDLVAHGKVLRGWIDIVPVPVYPSLAQRAGLTVSRGILVSSVVPGGNADAAGLRGGDRDDPISMGSMTVFLGGDVITSVDGRRVDTLQDYFAALEPTEPGDSVEVDFLRGGNRLTISIVLSERPDQFGW